jgi:ABC-type sugar transport system, periplasmic component
MRKIKRKTAFLAAVMTVAIAVSGCGGATAEVSNQGGENEYQTTYGSKQFDNVTLTVEIFDRSNAPQGSTVIDNRWVKYAQEEMGKVGINLEFVAVPRAEEITKIQTMMAAGTAPDIVMTYTRSIAEDYFNQGGTYDLSSYVDGPEQAQNLKAYLGDDVLNVSRDKDNNLWAISARRASATKNNLFIRKDWLDKLGMEIPTTTDELYDVLLAFKDNNPEGRTDVVPFFSVTIGEETADRVDVLSTSFMTSIMDEHEFNIKSVFPVYSDEGYGDYLKYLNKLYNEGMINQEYYTSNDYAQRLSESVVNGRVGVFEFNVNGNVDALRGGLLQNLQANNKEADIVSIPPLKSNHDGEIYNILYAQNGAYLIVPKTCKNPEAAVTYMDWLATNEGGFVLYHGFEGEHYELEDGVPIVIDADYNAIDKDWIRHDMFIVGNQGYFFTEEDFVKSASKEIPDYEEYVFENYENAIAGDAKNTTAYTSPTQSANITDIQLVVDEYLVKCITCKPEEFDDMLQAYKEALANAGMDEVIKERTEYYNALR